MTSAPVRTKARPSCFNQQRNAVLSLMKVWTAQCATVVNSKIVLSLRNGISNYQKIPAKVTGTQIWTMAEMGAQMQ